MSYGRVGMYIILFEMIICPYVFCVISVLGLPKISTYRKLIVSDIGKENQGFIAKL